MELAGPVIQLLQWISTPVSRCWKYHWGLKENIKILEQKMELLKGQNSDIQSRLLTEHEQGRTELKNGVQRWLKAVEDICAEINEINKRVETVKCLSRAGIGKNILQKIDRVRELLAEGEFPNGLVIQLPHQTGLTLPTPATLGGETFQRNIEEIWALLMGDEVRKIGVYGMGGVGKTTIMKHINNRLLEKKEKFDDIIWVTVSKDSSIIKLQDAIAKRLKLDISMHVDEITRAGMLSAELNKKGRYVLILDDLWDVYRLDEVGIPEPTPENGSKLVLTTRGRHVCLRMDCEAIPMECLSENEALNLFLDIVGRRVQSLPKMKEIVNSVVKECAGLPLAIAVTAGSLKGAVDYNDWRIALQDLERASAKGHNEILEKLKISYDRLNDKNLQACLLYCALFPEDYAIDKDALIEYLIAEEIVSGRNRQEALERGQDMLNRLVYACLLENTRDYCGFDWVKKHDLTREFDCVKMHDLIRDMALQITSNSPLFLVEAGTGLKCILDEENWKEDLAKVSLMHNDIQEIPSSFEAPKCPTLSTLLLNGNKRLRSISSHFFLHMKGLNLLDLSDSSIDSLPESISELVKLTTLLLRNCSKLTYVPSLAKVTALKTLNFGRSGIKQVTQGMENLTRLRYLDFGCPLEAIPDGILCKLSNLQYLSLRFMSKAKIRPEELIYLSKLETFCCVLFDLESFNAHVKSLAKVKPTNYLLQLGYGPYDEPGEAFEPQAKTVCIEKDINESVARSGDCQLLLPQDVEILEIRECKILSSLNELISFENVMSLKEWNISRCRLEHLFVYSSSIIRLIQGLETLALYKVDELRGLIKKENVASSPLPPGTFSSLKKLAVTGCHNIKRLFINPPLPNLEVIYVSHCEQLVEIMSTREDDEEEDQGIDEPSGSDHPANFTLPELSLLRLEDLPKLKNIPVVAGQSLQHVLMEKCPKLKRVPCLDKEPCPPSLNILIDDITLESLEWDHPNVKDAIQSIRVNDFSAWDRRRWHQRD